jgi:O-antigen ligase
LLTDRLQQNAKAPATIAFYALLTFLFIVYANPGNWFDGLEDIGFAKIAAGFSLAALAGSWLLYNRRLVLGGVQGWALVALFALVGFSSAWSFWPKYSFDTFPDGLKSLAVFFIIANVIDSEKRLATLIRVLALASVIPAVGAIWSHAHGEHLVEGDRAGWIGIFANPNDLAYHLVIGVAMLLAAAHAARDRRHKILWWALLAPTFYGIYLTQSRGGMFATVAVVVFWGLRSVKRAPLILGATCFAAALVFVSPNNPWSRRTQEATAYGEDVSARGRIDAWRTGLNIAKERPFTGVGAGAFMIAWPEFAPGDAGPVRTQHNTFIQLLSELGIPALVLFMGALLAALLGMRRASKMHSSLQPWVRGIQCGLIGFALSSLWGGIAFSWPIYLLLGMAFAARRITFTPDFHPMATKDDTVVSPMPQPVPALAGR